MKTFAAGLYQKEIVGMVYGFYTLLTLFMLPRLFLARDKDQLVGELRMILFFGLGNYIWALLTFAVFFLGERFPVTRPRILKNIVRHFFFSLALSAFFTSVYVVTVNSLDAGFLTAGDITAVFIINTVVNSFIYYSGSLAVHQAIFYSRKYREREFRLQQAELEMLKMQLHPHFFFNTLNAVSALMYRSPKEADRMITQLGDLFRFALRKEKAPEIRLRKELEFLESFLRIHQTLMGNRLALKWAVKPETLDALVPNLVLQPIVENAVKHGLAPLEEGGQIEISAVRENGDLILQIVDNGVGLTPAKIKNEVGVGLSNTRARLKNLYDGAQQFEISDAAGGGTAITLKIPFREGRPEHL